MITIIEIFIFILILRTFSECNILQGIKVHLKTVTRKDDIVVISAYSTVRITLYGTNIIRCNKAFLTKEVLPKGSACTLNNTLPYKLTSKGNIQHQTEMFAYMTGDGTMFFCLFCGQIWIHQGTGNFQSINVNKSLLTFPIWLMIIIIILLIVCSAIFSGLNLSLMTFSPSTLEFIILSGNKNERIFAKRIYPVRKLGNILLCSILLGNVLVNSTVTILVEKITKNALITLLFTTVVIVIFGEILPQAFAARHALIFGAQTIWIAIFIVILTFVLAYPIGKILNMILGKEIRQYYSKEKLKLLIKEQEKFGCVMRDEIEIISGALALNLKTVSDVMTPISHAYMINYHANLDYNTMKEIVRNGYTRIPVYENDKNNIKGILNIKDLTFIDPDDNIPVSTICTFYNRQILIVADTTKLPEMLDEFKKGKAHLAFVQKVVTDNDKDPYQLYVGLITLEDVIEEIFQDEILDENDIFTGNMVRKRTFDPDYKTANFNSPMKQFILTPQLYKATYEYMSKNISSFNETFVKKRVLESLLASKILSNHIHRMDKPESNLIIEAGHAIICGILIIQGKVSVKTTSENLFFEGGPFMLFGEQVFKNVNEYMKKSMTNNDFNTQIIFNNCKSIPDYTIVSMTDLQYVNISAAQYLLARNLSYHKPTIDFDVLRSEKYYDEWNGLGEDPLASEMG